jgi:hypothetical protein
LIFTLTTNIAQLTVDTALMRPFVLYSGDAAVRYVIFQSTFALLCFLMSSVAFAKYGHCVSVYEHATRNFSFSYTLQNTVNALFSQHCRADGSVNQRSLTVGLDVTIKKLPLSFTGTSTDAKQRLSNFCKVEHSNRLNSRSDVRQQDSVVVDALRAFNNCVELTDRGVNTTITTVDNFHSTIRVNFPAGDKISLLSASTGEGLTCTVNVTQYGLTSNQVIGPTTQIDFHEPFTITCRRQAAKRGNPQGAQQIFRRTSMIASFNKGDVSIFYPQEGILATDLASEIAKRISELEERLVKTQRELMTVSNKRFSITQDYWKRFYADEQVDLGTAQNHDFCALSAVEQVNPVCSCRLQYDRGAWKLLVGIRESAKGHCDCGVLCYKKK